MHPTMRVIESGDLRLEPQAVGHAEEMFAVLSDPAIYAHENKPPPSLDWLRARFTKLEARQSPDGSEQWLNWVLHLQGSGLIGFVQATIRPNREAGIAYVLASAYWGRGLASRAVEAMIAELAAHYQVRHLTAVLKRKNTRSLNLLQGLGFTQVSTPLPDDQAIEPDEWRMQLAL